MRLASSRLIPPCWSSRETLPLRWDTGAPRSHGLAGGQGGDSACFHYTCLLWSPVYPGGQTPQTPISLERWSPRDEGAPQKKTPPTHFYLLSLLRGQEGGRPGGRSKEGAPAPSSSSLNCPLSKYTQLFTSPRAGAVVLGF